MKQLKLNPEKLKMENTEFWKKYKGFHRALKMYSLSFWSIVVTF